MHTLRIQPSTRISRSSDPLNNMRTQVFQCAVFLSGAAGLMYQTLWIRQLGFIFGSTTLSTSIVISSFFFGLAAGSLYFGKRADQCASPIRLYRNLELGIAGTALLVWAGLPLLDSGYALLYRSVWGSLLLVNALKFALTFALLCVPTFLMGGTLPVMTKAFVRSTEGFAGALGRVYAVNTVGAFAGLMVMAFLLIELLGLRGAYVASIASSLLSAGLASAAVRDAEFREVEAEEGVTTKGNAPAWPLFLLSLALGALGLGYEVLWVRLWSFISLHSAVTPIGRAPAELSSTYVFSFILGLFLIGISLGGGLVGRLRRTGLPPLKLLAWIELAIGAYTLLALAVEQMLHLDGLAAKLVEIAVIVLPITILMGMGFPLLASAFVDSQGRLGAQFGRFYAVNTLGASLGPLATGMLLIPFKGTYVGLALFGAANLLVAVLLAVHTVPGWNQAVRVRALRISGVIGGLALAGLLAAPFQFSFSRIESKGTNILFEEDNHVGHTMVMDAGSGARSLIVNNNAVSLSHASSPFGEFTIQIPIALLGRKPEDILILCVGTGGSWKSTIRYDARVVAVDINPAVFRGMAYIHSPEVMIALGATNMQPVVNDARNYLLLDDRKYDLINIDPAPPITQPGMVNLHTREFYQLAKARLKPSGILYQRFSANVDSELLYKALLRSISDVFADVTVWSVVSGGVDVIASDAPLKVLHGRPELIDLELFATAEQYFVCGRREVARYVAGVPAVTDDRPLLEYHLLRRMAAKQGYDYPWLGAGRNREELMSLKRPMWDYIRKE